MRSNVRSSSAMRITVDVFMGGWEARGCMEDPRGPKPGRVVATRAQDIRVLGTRGGPGIPGTRGAAEGRGYSGQRVMWEVRSRSRPRMSSFPRGQGNEVYERLEGGGQGYR